MSRYLLLPHSCSATYSSLAVTSMRVELPSGKVSTTLASLLISRFTFDPVVYLDAASVLGREIRIGQGLREAVALSPCRGCKPHPVELRSDLVRLAGARLARFLGVDRLEHPGDRLPLCDRNLPQDVAVEVHRAVLAARPWSASSSAPSMPAHLSPVTSRTLERPRDFSHEKNPRHDSADSV